jgi:hypothetical protein
MLDMDDASIRMLGGRPGSVWEAVENVSLNRDRIVILIPHEESDPTSNPDLMAAGRDVRVKLICTGLQLTGFLRIPVRSTTTGFLHDANSRFLAITHARIAVNPGWGNLDAPDLAPDFCLINRQMITGCIESRTLILPQGSLD